MAGWVVTQRHGLIDDASLSAMRHFPLKPIAPGMIASIEHVELSSFSLRATSPLRLESIL